MRVLRQMFRTYSLNENLDDLIAFLEELQDVKCERRVYIEESETYAAIVGNYLIHTVKDMNKVPPAVGIIYVDSLDEHMAWLEGRGAERVIADWLPLDDDEKVGKPRTVTGGRNAYYRHPGGLLLEYFEAAPGFE